MKTMISDKPVLNFFLLKKETLFLITLTLITFIGFYQSIFFPFVNWDDPIYVIDNPVIKSWSLDHLKHIFTDFVAGNYHPLTMLSLAIDHTLGGGKPEMFHFTNLAFHLANTVLVFRLLILLPPYSIQVAFIGAIFFGIHPLHVESVVWVSERKDVLYSFFFLCSLISYINYTFEKKIGSYWEAYIFFLLSVLSKGMAVTLLPVIIALDLLLARNLQKKEIWIEKIPFAITSFAFGILVILAQKSVDAIQHNDIWTLSDRIVLAGYSFVSYILKLIFPINLSIIYPYPDKNGMNLPIYLWIYFFIALSILFGAILLYRRQKSYWFGLIFLFITLFPILQLLPVGRYIMADRYTYIPSIGWSFIIGLLLNNLLQKYSKIIKYGVLAFSVIYGFFLIYFTQQQCLIWKNDISLWSNTIQNYPKYWEGYYWRGNANMSQKNYKDALKDYTFLTFNYPKNGLGYFVSANALFQLKDYKSAINEYTRVLKMMDTLQKVSSKDKASLYLNRGVVYSEIGDLAQSINDLNKAKSLDPGQGEIYLNMGIIEFNRQNYLLSLSYFDTAIKLTSSVRRLYQIPGYNYTITASVTLAKSYHYRAYASYLLKEYAQAIKYCAVAISKDKSNFETYMIRGMAYVNTLDYQLAINDFNQAISLNPRSGEAYYNKGYLLHQMGNEEQGCLNLKKAKQLNFNGSGETLNKFCERSN